MSLAVMVLMVVAGIAVGATSIGGILVVPVLTVLAEIPVRVAVPASTLGFMFTGIAALLWSRVRRRRALAGATTPESPAARDSHAAAMSTLPLYAWALAGAALGALTLRWLPAVAVQGVLAALAIVSGLQTLLARQAQGEGDVLPPVLGRRGPVALLGLFVGCGSAWSGTGGPVLLLPLLMVLGAPTRAAILLAQGIQLPIALSATAVNLAAGQLDLRLGLALGGLLLAGWAVGTWIASRMATRTLKRGVAVGLIVVGVAYCLQSL